MVIVIVPKQGKASVSAALADVQALSKEVNNIQEFPLWEVIMHRKSTLVSCFFVTDYRSQALC